MTDFDPTDDDLVSAYLDDEVTTEEAAEVEARPELVARVEELRSIQQSLRAPITTAPSTAAIDDMIGAALGEFDSTGDAEVHRFPNERPAVASSAATERPTAARDATSKDTARHGPDGRVEQSGVADLKAARERKSRRGVWLLSAAAAVLLAVAIPAALSSIGGGDDSGGESASSDMALETASVESDSGTSGSDDSAGGSADAMDAVEAATSEKSAQEDEAASSDVAAAAATAAAPTTTVAAIAESQALDADGAADLDLEAEEADAAMADDVDGRDGGLSFFASTPTIDDLLVNLEQPGFLEELEAVSQEFGAPVVECAGEGETGGLAELTATGQVVEIILPASTADTTDPTDSAVRIVDRQTCADLATFER